MEKAESLYRFAQGQGSPLSTFQLTLTEPEAAELLNWYGLLYSGTNEMFDADFEIAKRTCNPWPILSQFELMGLKIQPLSTLQ